MPYIPAMDQWLRRIEKIREYAADGWFGNWCHCRVPGVGTGTADHANELRSAARGRRILAELARNNYGEAACPSCPERLERFQRRHPAVSLFG